MAGALRFDELQIENTEYYDYYVQLAVFINLAWLLLSFVFKTYRTGMRPEPRQSAGKVLNVYFVHLFLLLLFFVSLKRSDYYSRLFLVYFYAGAGISIFIWHFYFMRLLRFYRSRGRGGRKVVLLGDGKALQKLAQQLSTKNDYGLKLLGFYGEHADTSLPLSGDEQALEIQLDSLDVDEIYAAFPANDPRWLKWYRLADQHLIRFRMVPDLDLTLANRLQIDFIDRIPVLTQRTEPLEKYHNRLIKRFLDVVVSVLMMVLVFPCLVPLIALFIKLEDGGPIFFKQDRAGLNGSRFSIYKFRSLRVSQEDTSKQVVRADKRLTRIGKFMRRHSLDELPQFFNVLRGEMSVIGPRPHMLEHTEEYRQHVEHFMVRHFVKPGITGLAQIKGFRGQIHKKEDIEARIAADVYYLENWSILLELRILFTTVFKVFWPDRAAI
jgi:Undecaprenyl-phosphate glucose phosphotransferase